jgi:hypothetical protein
LGIERAGSASQSVEWVGFPELEFTVPIGG